MVYVNQLITILEYGLPKNKRFLRELYSADLEGKIMNFDILDCSISWHREGDPSMTLERFLKEMRTPHITLQINSPIPHVIRYGASYEQDIGRTVSHFAWVECPYSDENFARVGSLYLKTFNKRIEDEPVLPGVLDYYEEHKGSFKKKII
ncbi:MAG: hypothetical protein V1725_02560 [archaeon]